ncbi:LuxR C-terminal-related transcriptional regulator [Nonomuraea sp. NPDC050536]|uniref:DUF7134 domain-containing protein n=1 Tax=Nonomuraea sp. NPDC050536 TaxID=3364366 RepID=UPI0037C9476D
MLARHQDTLVIALLALCCLIQIRYLSTGADNAWATLSLHAALLVPLAWRRRHPVAVFAIVALASLIGWLAGFALLAANGAVLIAMYGVAALSRLRWAIAAGAVAEFGIALLVIRPNASLAVLAKEYAAFSVFVVAIWIAGIQAGTRRRYVASLVEQTRQQTLIAAAAERARIARELHDVVAHDVSVIVLHADGAGYALRTEPDVADQALRTIADTGRRALAEMRRLVGLLRDDADSREPCAPQPGLAGLTELVEQARASGLPVELTLRGPTPSLPEGQQLAIYRIVQEALTNALKHGGAGTRARVEVDFRPGEVRIDIADDGQGAPKVLILTTFDLDEYAFAAIKAGASSFLLKDVPAADLFSAIRSVHAGDAVIAPSATRRLLERFAVHLPDGSPRPEPDNLTAREQEVLLHVARGLSNADIAQHLRLAEATVKSHLNRIMAKLGIHGRAQAVVYAYESGLVTPADQRKGP